LLLLVGAGLFLRTFLGLLRVDPGFQPEPVLTFRLNAATAGYEGRELVEFYERVRESVIAMPGVESVALSHVALISGSRTAGAFTVPGGPAGQAEHLRVGESFFETMGIPILLGRGFTPADRDAAPQVVIVNDALARAFFTGDNPVGGIIRLAETDYEIVGVCRDASYYSLGLMTPTIYFPYRQHLSALDAMFFEARTAVPPLSVASSVRRVVASLDPNVPLTALKTQTALIDESIMPYRLFAVFCGILAALALALSAIGLYGVVAYGVTRRTGEIGIRMALGAGRGEILWMVLREALVLVVVGIALGVPPALAATAVARGVLFGVRFADPASLAGAIAVLLLVTVVAASAPALRATRVHPAGALRHQ
jgi:predicted permease